MAEEKETAKGASEEKKLPPKRKDRKKEMKKLSKMTLEEVNQALENAQKHMGGYQSAFARALLVRKRELSPSAEAHKEAA